MSEFKGTGNFKLDDNGTFQSFDMSEHDENGAIVFQMTRDCGSFIVSFEADGTFTIDEVSK